MPHYSRRSIAKLYTCDERLVTVMLEVVKAFDNTIVFGRRGKRAQDKAVAEGRSEKPWPQSKHNARPPDLSKAVDAAPYIRGKGVVWEIRQCYYFSGYVMAIVKDFGYPIRTGADWDGDMDVNDQHLRDCCHFEIVG